LIGATSTSFGQQAFEIKVANIKKDTGRIIVEIFDSKSSWLKTAYKKVVLITDKEAQIASFNANSQPQIINLYKVL
jgi:uncharacterized protein (DUF2141 family)